MVASGLESSKDRNVDFVDLNGAALDHSGTNLPNFLRVKYYISVANTHST